MEAGGGVTVIFLFMLGVFFVFWLMAGNKFSDGKIRNLDGLMLM
jgi:hypothetical protein